MTVVTLYRLPDAPLIISETARQERIHKVADMAADLLFNNAYADIGDAIMVLLSCGHPTFEVHALVAEARQIAMEHVVAMEMSSP